MQQAWSSRWLRAAVLLTVLLIVGFGSPRDGHEVTLYELFCQSGFDGYECDGELLTLKSMFRVRIGQREVAYVYPTGSGTNYSTCTIFDVDNWYCPRAGELIRSLMVRQ